MSTIERVLRRPKVGWVTTPWLLPAADLDELLDRAKGDLELWRGARVLVTGGTGALGSWLVASLLRADAALGLGLRIEVLTRKPALVPLPIGPELSLCQGDVSDLVRVSGTKSYDVIIHGAASSSATYGHGDGEPRSMSATIVDGTRSVLEVASRSRARVLFLSSGAIYGAQGVDFVAEDAGSGPDPMDPRAAYGEAKRLAENLCATSTAAGEADVVVGRLFSFIGPRMPVSGHFAAGNFLADAMAGRAIRVRGDGRAIRSYLYAGDLPEWCWALLARGKPGRAYNVGSCEPVSIAGLARQIASAVSPIGTVEILGSPNGLPPHRYVPDVRRAADELQLEPRVELATAIKKSLRWLASQ